MEAPEKIYVHVKGDKVTNTWNSTWIGVHDIEYTRTDTIEAKKVDIETSTRHYLLNEHKSPLNEVFHQADLKVEMQYHADIENAFKAGFELGLKSKGE